MKSRSGANFSVTTERVNGFDFLRVVDRGDGVTVTNDAENVVSVLKHMHGATLTPETIIVYRDTERRWDELMHDGTSFTGFRILSAGSFMDAAMKAISIRKQLNG